MNKITIIIIALSLYGCSWPYIAATYGSRYGFNVSGAVYAESKGFKIVDRPDLQAIFVTAPFNRPLEAAEHEPEFKAIAVDYLSLDRNCEITNAEVMILTNVEYTYQCKK